MLLLLRLLLAWTFFLFFVWPSSLCPSVSLRILLSPIPISDPTFTPPSSKFLISSLSVTQDATPSPTPADRLVHPKHFPLLLSLRHLSNIPFLSQLFTPRTSVYFSLSPSSLTLPTRPLPSLPVSSLSLGGGGGQCRPTQGPQCGPSREGKGVPRNTHNSVPPLGLRDKGKPHTWLTMWVRLVEEEASNWHQSPPLRVCGYMSVCVRENECVMSRCNLMAMAPSSSSQPSILWETCSSLPPSPPPTPSATPTATRCLCERRGQSRALFWGGHQLVLPHGVTWPMNRGTPEPSTHIISVVPLKAAVSSPHRLHLVLR